MSTSEPPLVWSSIDPLIALRCKPAAGSARPTSALTEAIGCLSAWLGEFAMRTMVALRVLTIALFAPYLLVQALAAPNDFRVISGTLLEPARLNPDTAVAVVKSDEGPVYADLRAVSRIPTVERGAAVTLVGFEGARSDQIAAQVIYPPEAVSEPTDVPLVRSQRIHGRIESLAGALLVVRVADGKAVTLVLRGVSAKIRGLLQRGDVVTVFGRPAETDF